MLIGLGVPDPVGVFGTTLDLTRHGERVSDLPAAENGMAGVALGATIAGMRADRHPRPHPRSRCSRSTSS